MWSMGKVLKTPEVMRVFIGSFWDQPLLHTDNAALFEAEQKDLMTELRNLPQNAAIRKINEFVKRARLAKVHAYVIGHLKDKMPSMVGKEKKQKELIANMAQVFREVQQKYHLPPGDFPNLDDFCQKCMGRQFSKFSNLNVKAIQEIDDLLSKDIPKLMSLLPKQSQTMVDLNPIASNPFDTANKATEWEIQPYKAEFDTIFKTLRIDAMGRASGQVCMAPLQATGCPQETLKAVWELSDVDKDGCLDAEEFAVAMYLCNKSKEGEVLPAALPDSMRPPSKLNAVIPPASPMFDMTARKAGIISK